MNEPKAQQEPSMEEILASIRRIISEDEPAEGKKAEAPADERNSEDVLELTEIAEEEPPAVPEPEEEPEVAEIDFDAPVEAEAEEEIDLEAPAEAEQDEELELREEAAFAEAVAPEAPVEEPVPAPVPEPVVRAPDAAVDNSLISTPPAAAATGSLASLVAAVDRAKGGAQLGDANRTIEDLVKEVMRPMIREWLDQNLPGLVERLVRREIERLSRSAEGDS